MDKQDLIQQDSARDLAFCGCSLAEERATRFSEQGAHDPTASYYFVLEDLFARLNLQDDSHLLDVGCGAGRALAYFAAASLPGCATGVELDPELAERCRTWIVAQESADAGTDTNAEVPTTNESLLPRIAVTQGSVLKLNLSRYTHFYLFNPFDSRVLIEFIARIEAQVDFPITLCHMSDNGETYFYLGRPGWSIVDQGEFHMHNGVCAYVCPQHWTIWRYDPAAATSAGSGAV